MRFGWSFALLKTFYLNRFAQGKIFQYQPKLIAAEAADSLSASKVLKEAANWLKAASKGNEDEEDGVEGLEEKSLREDMGDDEFEVPFPAICL